MNKQQLQDFKDQTPDLIKCLTQLRYILTLSRRQREFALDSIVMHAYSVGALDAVRPTKEQYLNPPPKMSWENLN